MCDESGISQQVAVRRKSILSDTFLQMKQQHFNTNAKLTIASLVKQERMVMATYYMPLLVVVIFCGPEGPCTPVRNAIARQKGDFAWPIIDGLKLGAGRASIFVL